MSESRFDWDNLPETLLGALAAELDLDAGAVAKALAATYGTPPQASFVRAAWPVLRDVWLAARPELRTDVAAGLRAAGLGDESIDDDAAYLASCANAKALRGVVLATFLEAGRTPGPAGASGEPEPAAGERTQAPSGVIEIESIEQLDRATEMVLAALDEHGGQVGRNDDGDMLVPHGSALTFVRAAVEPPRLHFASPLLTGVPESPELIARLNGMNAQIAFGRLFHSDDAVVAEMELICRPFVPEHVAIATNIMSRLADEVDDILQGEFGGKTFFGDAMPPKVAETYGYGGYL